MSNDTSLTAETSLADRVTGAPVSTLEPRIDCELEALEKKATESDGLAPLGALLQRPEVRRLLVGIFAGSPYLSGLIRCAPERLLKLLSSDPDVRFAMAKTELAVAMAEAQDKPQAMRLLRAFKSEVALLTALADLGGVWPVMHVTDVLSETADITLQNAVRFLFRQAVQNGDWQVGPADQSDDSRPDVGSGYIVLAMGKHGARELNYSSDIDLIIFFDPDVAKLRDGLESSSFFVRMTRDLVQLMDERTADGYVFRTDLRLRPDAGATQAALSVHAALSYYESVGQNWERAALLKARPVAGDLEAGAEILQALAPFIWRKYLDFAAISDIHAMKRQVHAFRGLGEISIAGHNVKLGRGGIREIEFFVQTQQLIAGGRQADLRVRPTLEALERLEERGWITSDVRNDLDAAYRFLRTLEH
ncbi:MAG: bifunctional [glutamine synthetase] adenylyltransferase/[glutamine synthetase]-adenylyl-L-tyrosine phosphorylase, partial [Alphaproteobacteria bacterium]|nr:bifunctional [glutamine synthetase] adenylyltransferase/[glutamine synthetase]-adenylyl-L-tyrosine phosphorylase [Alphaproteobacteria bacterium]